MSHLLLALALAAPPTAVAPDLAARVDAHVQPYVDRHAFSGVVLVARGDEVVLSRAYGLANAEFGVPNTPETRFAIASISKRFTHVVVSRLVAEGRLATGDTLSKWAPSFPSADKITIAHLLGHTSGLRDPEKLRGKVRVSFTPAEVVDELAREPLGSAPGAEFSYTTANYAVLAFVIERVTGAPYEAAVRRYVFDPAGMKDSGELATASVVPRLASGYMPDPFGDGLAVCGPEDPSWKVGGGATYATAADLHRFSRALFGGRLLGTDDPRQVLPLGKIHDRPVLRSNGSFPGAGANLLYLPDDELTVVVLTNNYASVAGSVAEALAAMALGRPVTSPEVKLSTSPVAFDPTLLGSYGVPGRPWRFTNEMRNGRPGLAWTRVRRSALLPIDATHWFMPLDWGILRLERVDGVITGALLFPGQEPLKVVPESPAP